MPGSVKNLVSVSLLRSAGGKYGIVSVECGRRDTVIRGEGPLIGGLGRKKFWIGSEGKAVGPGGTRGLEDIIHALRHGKQVR